MATATIYALSTFDKDKLSIAITGTIKVKVKSQLDDDVGESNRLITPKLVNLRTDNKVIGRLLTIIAGLEHLKKLKVSTADRSYIWTIDRDTVDLINKNTASSLIESLKGMDVEEDLATTIVGQLYGFKIELGTRIGYQDKTKPNRYVDQATKMLAENGAPKIPEWSEALEKARRQAQMDTIKNEITIMDTIQGNDNVEDKSV